MHMDHNSLLTCPIPSQRTDENPHLLSDSSVNTLCVYITNTPNAHTSFGFLKRWPVQKCWPFCQSCCILCLDISFKFHTYLITWCSDAAPTSLHHTLLWSLLANIMWPVYIIWCNHSHIGYGNQLKTLITNMAEMAQYQPIYWLPIQLSIQPYYILIEVQEYPFHSKISQSLNKR